MHVLQGAHLFHVIGNLAGIWHRIPKHRTPRGNLQPGYQLTKTPIEQYQAVDYMVADGYLQLWS
jgi:hypothetical protein